MNHCDHFSSTRVCFFFLVTTCDVVCVAWLEKERKEEGKKKKRTTRDLNSQQQSCSETCVQALISLHAARAWRQVLQSPASRCTGHVYGAGRGRKKLAEGETIFFCVCCFDPQRVVWHVWALPEAGGTVQGGRLVAIGPSTFNHNAQTLVHPPLWICNYGQQKHRAACQLCSQRGTRKKHDYSPSFHN